MSVSTEPSPWTIRYERAQLLCHASRLTVDVEIPEAVRDNAAVLQAWLEDAADPEDRKDRFSALERADANRIKREPDDDPGRLISEAETYYAFLKAG